MTVVKQSMLPMRTSSRLGGVLTLNVGALLLSPGSVLVLGGFCLSMKLRFSIYFGGKGRLERYMRGFVGGLCGGEWCAGGDC